VTVPARHLQRLVRDAGDRLCAAAIVLAGLAGNALLWITVWKYFD
jgi:hypothetical protein